jgi:hypothetical protein
MPLLEVHAQNASACSEHTHVLLLPIVCGLLPEAQTFKCCLGSIHCCDSQLPWLIYAGHHTAQCTTPSPSHAITAAHNLHPCHLHRLHSPSACVWAHLLDQLGQLPQRGVRPGVHLDLTGGLSAALGVRLQPGR